MGEMGEQAEVKVYRGTTDLWVGPLWAHKEGDHVVIPDRDRPWPLNDHVKGFDGIVYRVDPDGVAKVMSLEAYEAIQPVTEDIKQPNAA